MNYNVSLNIKPAEVIKIALFGSYYRGFSVLDELLNGPLSDFISVVGVVTDDPSANFISSKKRIWQYGYNSQEANMVADLAKLNDCEVYKGKVKCESFYDLIEKKWMPDLCIMATFGQKIDARLYNYPTMGFINFHPSDDRSWPSKYAGPNPFSEMIKDGHKDCFLTLHCVDSSFDTGSMISRTERIPIPPSVSPKDMHKISSPYIRHPLRCYISEKINNKSDQKIYPSINLKD